MDYINTEYIDFLEYDFFLKIIPSCMTTAMCVNYIDVNDNIIPKLKVFVFFYYYRKDPFTEEKIISFSFFFPFFLLPSWLGQ